MEGVHGRAGDGGGGDVAGYEQEFGAFFQGGLGLSYSQSGMSFLPYALSFTVVRYFRLTGE